MTSSYRGVAAVKGASSGMREIVISHPVRTAIGACNGALKSVPATDLGGLLAHSAHRLEFGEGLASTTIPFIGPSSDEEQRHTTTRRMLSRPTSISAAALLSIRPSALGTPIELTLSATPLLGLGHLQQNARWRPRAFERAR